MQPALAADVASVVERYRRHVAGKDAPADTRAERRIRGRVRAAIEPAVAAVARDQAAGGGLSRSRVRGRIERAAADALNDDVVNDLVEQRRHVRQQVARDAAADLDFDADRERRRVRDQLDDTAAGLVDGTVRRLAAVDWAANADAVDGLVGEIAAGEAARTARVQVRSQRNDATAEAERDAGVAYHQWVAVADDRTREGHMVMDGQIAEVGGLFSNGRSWPNASNCRCQLVAWTPPAGMRPPAGRSWFYPDELESEE